MIIACMCICINIFTEYAVYDYYRENRKNHTADSPAEYYRRTLAIPLLDCRTGFTIFISVQNCIQSLYLVPTIAVDSEHDLNDFVSLYEKDLVDK